MAMKSLEMQPEPMLDMPMQSSFPSFMVCDEQMPEVTDWPVDGEYTLTVKVRVKTKDQESTVDGVDTDSCLEILSYEVQE